MELGCPGPGRLASRTSDRQRSPQALAFSNFRTGFPHALSCRVGGVIRARFKEESFLKRTQQDVGTIIRKKKARGPDVWVWRFYEVDEMGITRKRSVMLAGDADECGHLLEYRGFTLRLTIGHFL